MTSFRIVQGDCIEVMNAAKPHSCDAIICDPPYGIEFAGNEWDSPQRMVGEATGVSGGFNNIPAGEPRPDMDRCDPRLFQRWCEEWGNAALRVLKPGGHLFAFGSPRMYARLVCGLEDAGFESRDMIGWIHGEGFCKGKKIKGHEGWQTPCLSPAIEPIAVMRAPMKVPGKRPGTWRKAGTPENMDVHGVGGFNIDAARVGDERMVNGSGPSGGMNGWNKYRHGEGKYEAPANYRTESVGRVPKNVIIDEQVAEELGPDYARYFYVAKVKGSARPDHPTVKPVELMKQLVMHELMKLSVPEGGQILDPFCGSGTTGVAALRLGYKFVGIESDAKYAEIAQERCSAASRPAAGPYCPVTAGASVDCATPQSPCWDNPDAICWTAV